MTSARWRAVLVACMTAAATLSSPAVASVARSEVVIESAVGIEISHVRLHVPMLPGSAPHPGSCDYLEYLRYRWSDGPTDPQASDGVLVMQPGAWQGGMALDRLARNTMRALAGRGERVEWWSVSRRSSCAFDLHGLKAANAAGDAQVAYDYYFGGKTVDGKAFDGFPSDADLAYVGDMGAAQLVQDQYDMLRLELPDAEFRRTKTFCGGNSDGGLVMGAMGAWDFGGGKPENAGYNQCAGFFAIDSLVTADPLSLQELPLTRNASDLIGGRSHDAVVAAVKAGALPRTSEGAPVASPAVWAYLSMVGLAAHHAPDDESTLNKQLPRDWLFEATQRINFARTYLDALTGLNSIRDFRFTNEALLGVWLDDNHLTASFSQMSVGGVTGGPVGPKEVLWPDEVTRLPLAGYYLGGVTGPTEKVGPTDQRALYRWRSYDEVADVGYTTPEQEVVDIGDLAKQLSGDRIAWADPYFPNRWTYDLIAMWSGDRSGELAPMRYDAELKAKPLVTIWGEDGLEVRAKPIFPANTVYLPGYTHIDTSAAAWQQNNGKPEAVTDNLTAFVSTQLDG